MSFKEHLNALHEIVIAKAKIKWITKILLSYLLLTMFMIGAVPIISNHFTDMLYHNEVNYNDKQLFYISNEIDNYLRNVKSQVYILSNSPSLKKLSMIQSKYDPDFLLYSDKFYIELSSLYNINDIAADISIYFKDIDFFVTKSGSCNFEDYVNMQLQYDKYNSEDIQNFIFMNDAEFALLPASKSNFANGIVSQNNIEHLIPVTIRMINNDTSYLINKVCLFINLSAEKIFRNTNANNVGGSIYIMNEKGEVISSANTTADDEAALSVVQSKIRSSQLQEALSQFEIDDSKTMITYRKSPMYGLFFIAITPKSIFDEKLRDSRKLMYWISILLFTASVIISTIFSKIFSLPIKKIVNSLWKRNNQQSGIKLKVNNEFQYIMNAITNITNENSQMAFQINRNQEYAAEMLIRQILNNNIDANEIKKFINDHSLLFNYSYYFMIDVRMNFDTTIQASAIHELCLHMKKCLEQELAELPGLEPICNALISNYEIVAACNALDKEIGKQAGDAIINSLCKIIKKYENDVILTIGVGGVYSDIAALRLSYTNASDAISNKLISSQERITFYNRASIDRSNQLSLEKEINAFTGYMNNANIAEAIKVFAQISAKCKGNYLSLGRYKQIVNVIVINTFNHINSRSALFIDEFSYIKTVIEQNNILYDFDRIENNILHLLNIVKEKYELVNRESDQVIEYIRSYINDHFSSDITLAKLADLVNMNPDYLSIYFKKKTGIAFKTFVDTVCITKVKDLMLHGNKTISEISVEFGYPNANTLIRIFKKMEGLTPNEFKKKSQLSGNHSNH